MYLLLLTWSQKEPVCTETGVMTVSQHWDGTDIYSTVFAVLGPAVSQYDWKYF